tara:strand:+ start:258 stop:671 length:414 start_codon:yes stop_codon:yes gene_type:complete
MKHFTTKVFSLIMICFLFFGNARTALSRPLLDELAECIVVTHCVRNNWEVSNATEAFEKAAKLISETPRTKIIEQNNSYLHAEAVTRWMHYIDDLEIKALPEKGILQVRSESRVGIGDNGVNKRRIDNLAYQMSSTQ